MYLHILWRPPKTPISHLLKAFDLSSMSLTQMSVCLSISNSLCFWWDYSVFFSSSLIFPRTGASLSFILIYIFISNIFLFLGFLIASFSYLLSLFLFWPVFSPHNFLFFLRKLLLHLVLTEDTYFKSCPNCPFNFSWNKLISQFLFL